MRHPVDYRSPGQPTIVSREWPAKQPDRLQLGFAAFLAVVVAGSPGTEFDFDLLVFVKLLIWRAVSVVNGIQPHPFTALGDTPGANHLVGFYRRVGVCHYRDKDVSGLELLHGRHRCPDHAKAD